MLANHLYDIKIYRPELFDDSVFTVRISHSDKIAIYSGFQSPGILIVLESVNHPKLRPLFWTV